MTDENKPTAKTFDDVVQEISEASNRLNQLIVEAHGMRLGVEIEKISLRQRFPNSDFINVRVYAFATEFVPPLDASVEELTQFTNEHGHVTSPFPPFRVQNLKDL